MTKTLSCPPRHFATIAGYRQACTDLEMENAALKRELAAMRAALHRQADGALWPRAGAFMVETSAGACAVRH